MFAREKKVTKTVEISHFKNNEGRQVVVKNRDKIGYKTDKTDLLKESQIMAIYLGLALTTYMFKFRSRPDIKYLSQCTQCFPILLTCTATYLNLMKYHKNPYQNTFMCQFPV